MTLAKLRLYSNGEGYVTSLGGTSPADTSCRRGESLGCPLESLDKETQWACLVRPNETRTSLIVTAQPRREQPQQHRALAATACQPVAGAASSCVRRLNPPPPLSPPCVELCCVSQSRCAPGVVARDCGDVMRDVISLRHGVATVFFIPTNCATLRVHRLHGKVTYRLAYIYLLVEMDSAWAVGRGRFTLCEAEVK